VAVAPQRPHRDEVGRDPGRPGIGVTAHPALGTPVHREAVPPCAVRRPLLDELGHDVVDAEPALNGDRFLRGFLAMVLHLRLMVDEAKAGPAAVMTRSRARRCCWPRRPDPQR
jgi:hypothetical protein